MDIKGTTNKNLGMITIAQGSNGELVKLNSIIIKKGEFIPIVKKIIFYAWPDDCWNLQITECTVAETNIDFVNIIKNINCLIPKELPPGPPGIILEIGLDKNQVVKVLFKDGRNGSIIPHEEKNLKIDDDINLDDFLVE